MAQQSRTRLAIVAGLVDSTTDVADALRQAEPGTVSVHHDLRRLSEGVVVRRIHHGTRERTTALELAHGCVSCTLRQDVLPLLRNLAGSPDVHRIVLWLDPVLEPEAICWALTHVLVGEETVAEHLDVEAVVTVVDSADWLASATGDKALAEHGLTVTAEDDRSLAQVAVGQAEFADAIVLAGNAPDGWTAARTAAVLDRLAPAAARTHLTRLDPVALLADLPANARRGRVDHPHDPILRGEPPLDTDAGCAMVLFDDRRPFHPQRLHDAIDVLLDGVVRTRGRVWVASQPDMALWLESAGGGLRIGQAGRWLAASDQADWDAVTPQRRAMAALRWDPYYGDRAQELAILTHAADPDVISAALREALLTDEELALGWDAWRTMPDPFGTDHTDPCEDNEPAASHTGSDAVPRKEDE